MKTTAKTLTSFGNCTLLQFAAEPASVFTFKPGGPEIINGGLVISEAGGSGLVGNLVAVNNTAFFLLLTDADVLVGARQNRVLNKSVLLSPFSKTVLDVSCVERGRWHFTTRTFNSPAAVADHDLRKSKARTVAAGIMHAEDTFRTQQEVWSHISEKMHSERCVSDTENYADLVFHKQGKQKTGFPACEPENGCNGLAVFIDRKIACADIFGNAETYRHYFPKLRDSAFLQAVMRLDEKPVDMHEACYKVVDVLDNMEITDKTPDMHYSGAGSLGISETREFLGFELNCGGELVHNCVFGK